MGEKDLVKKTGAFLNKGGSREMALGRKNVR